MKQKVMCVGYKTSERLFTIRERFTMLKTIPLPMITELFMEK